MEEPSVLDFLKSKLMPWRGERLEMPQAPPVESAAEAAEVSLQDQSPALLRAQGQQSSAKASAQAITLRLAIPWRSLAALFLALAAQYSLGLAHLQGWKPGATLLILSMAFLTWATLSKEWILPPIPEASTEAETFRIGRSQVLLGMFLALVAFASFGTLQFNLLNVTILLVALGFIIQGTWISKEPESGQPAKPRRWLVRPPWSVTIRWLAVVAIVVVGWVAFFRLYNLAQVPPEMNSDHAEKFLDVLRILNGQTRIFFPTNGGREGLQFYLVAGLHRLLGMPLNFFILKFVSSLIGFLALPFPARKRDRQLACRLVRLLLCRDCLLAECGLSLRLEIAILHVLHGRLGLLSGARA